MAKTTYEAVVNGVKFTRTTDAREYSHAIVWVSNDGKLVRQEAWAGRPDLAAKQHGRANTLMFTDAYIKESGANPDDYRVHDRYDDCRVVEGKLQAVPATVKEKRSQKVEKPTASQETAAAEATPAPHYADKDVVSPRQEIAAKLQGCHRLTVSHSDGCVHVWTRDAEGEWNTPANGDARYTELTMIDTLAAAKGEYATITFEDMPATPRFIASRYSFQRPGSWAVWDRQEGRWANTPTYKTEADAVEEARSMNH